MSAGYDAAQDRVEEPAVVVAVEPARGRGVLVGRSRDATVRLSVIPIRPLAAARRGTPRPPCRARAARWWAARSAVGQSRDPGRLDVP